MKTLPIQGSGISWPMGQIQQRFEKAAERQKPIAVLTDTRESPARCYTCRSDVPETGCPTCNGAGDLPELQSVDMTVFRGFDEVPCQVSIRDGKVIDAWVVATIGEPGEIPRWANGQDIALSLEEQAAALEASK